MPDVVGGGGASGGDAGPEAVEHAALGIDRHAGPDLRVRQAGRERHHLKEGGSPPSQASSSSECSCTLLNQAQPFCWFAGARLNRSRGPKSLASASAAMKPSAALTQLLP